MKFAWPESARSELRGVDRESAMLPDVMSLAFRYFAVNL
jgi:hypothetical protein